MGKVHIEYLIDEKQQRKAVVLPVQKQLAMIDRQVQPRIIEAICELAQNPHPAGCRKLSGRPAWRVRIGAYRVIYEIDNADHRVLVVTIGHRRDIYG